MARRVNAERRVASDDWYYAWVVTIRRGGRTDAHAYPGPSGRNLAMERGEDAVSVWPDAEVSIHRIDPYGGDPIIGNTY